MDESKLDPDTTRTLARVRYFGQVAGVVLYLLVLNLVFHAHNTANTVVGGFGALYFSRWAVGEVYLRCFASLDQGQGPGSDKPS